MPPPDAQPSSDGAPPVCQKVSLQQQQQQQQQQGSALAAGVCVVVRGVATVEDAQVLERRALVHTLDAAEKESKVRGSARGACVRLGVRVRLCPRACVCTPGRCGAGGILCAKGRALCWRVCKKRMTV